MAVYRPGQQKVRTKLVPKEREREAKRKNRLEMEISKGLRARRRFYGPPPRPFDVHLEIKKNFTLNLFINQGNIDDFF